MKYFFIIFNIFLLFNNPNKTIYFLEKKVKPNSYLIYDNLKKDSIIKSTIDSISVSEIKRYSEKKRESIFDYYKLEDKEQFGGWSEKLFGDCCTEADPKFSDFIPLKVTCNKEIKKYPISNLLDTKYKTAYVFKENEKISINLFIDNKYHIDYIGKEIGKIIKDNDTIMSPLKLSFINGYVKSKELFYKNGRIKKMKVLINNKLQTIVECLDSPIVQMFEIKAIFRKNDVITLVPLSYYKGTKYNDICISEIQSNLGYIIHPSIDKKYILNDLYKK